MSHDLARARRRDACVRDLGSLWACPDSGNDEVQGPVASVCLAARDPIAQAITTAKPAGGYHADH